MPAYLQEGTGMDPGGQLITEAVQAINTENKPRTFFQPQITCEVPSSTTFGPHAPKSQHAEERSIYR